MEKYAENSVERIWVVNADSEDYHKKVPDGYDNSWLTYWKEERRRKYGNADASFCRKCGSKSNIIGGHVKPQKDDGNINKIYIVPLCSGCNNHNDPDYEKPFQVNKDDLVEIDMSKMREEPSRLHRVLKMAGKI